MSIRYQLLTYLYTAVYKQNQTGLPTLNPMFFNNLDDDVSVVQDTVSEIDFKYEGGKLSMTGSFEYDAGVNVETITLLGVDSKPEGAEDADYDEDNKKLVLHVDVSLTGKYEATIA
jgi:alpha-glucosidase